LKKSEDFLHFYNGLGKNKREFEKDVAETVALLQNLSELLPSLQVYFVFFLLLLFNEHVE
jgi:hypothetical protein